MPTSDGRLFPLRLDALGVIVTVVPQPLAEAGPTHANERGISGEDFRGLGGAVTVEFQLNQSPIKIVDSREDPRKIFFRGGVSGWRRAQGPVPGADPIQAVSRGARIERGVNRRVAVRFKVEEITLRIELNENIQFRCGAGPQRQVFHPDPVIA